MKKNSYLCSRIRGACAIAARITALPRTKQYKSN